MHRHHSFSSWASSSCATQVTSNCCSPSKPEKYHASSGSNGSSCPLPNIPTTFPRPAVVSPSKYEDDDGDDHDHDNDHDDHSEDESLPSLWVKQTESGTEVCLGNPTPTRPSVQKISSFALKSPEKLIASEHHDDSDDECSTTIVTPPKFCSGLLTLETISEIIFRKKSKSPKKRNGGQGKNVMPTPAICSKGQLPIISQNTNTESKATSPYLIPTCGASFSEESPAKVIPFQCGANSCCNELLVLGPAEAKQRKIIEVNIGKMLGNCNNNWQSWSLGCCGYNRIAPDAEPEASVRMLRNRAGNLNSQARRFRNLNESAIHLNGRVGKDEDYAQIQMRSYRSFDDRLKTIIEKRTKLNSMDTTPCSSVAGTSTSLSSCAGNLKGVFAESKGTNDEELYYDSDPGQPTRIKPFRSSNDVDKLKSLRVEDFTALNTTMELKNSQSCRSTSSSTDEESFEEPFVLDMEDSFEIEGVIKETLYATNPLFLHPKLCAKDQSYAPLRVKAWIELGSQLRSRLVQPKFVWKIMQESEADWIVPSVSNVGVRKVELLDIMRVIEKDEIDRTTYPFAKRERSFILETLNETIMFEAASKACRDKFCTGLKLCIARLGSKIVMGDYSVLDEFFSPFGAVDPGRPPSILRSPTQISA